MKVASGELPLRDLRAAVDNMAEAVLVFDTGYTILYQNATAFALTRVPTGQGRDAIEKVIERRAPDGTPIPIERAPIMRALRGETVRNEEVHLYNREKRTHIVVLYNADPIRDETGAVVRAVVNIRDITDHKRMRRRAADQEAQLRALFENLAEPLFVADAGTLRVTTNAAFRQSFLPPGTQLETVAEYGQRFELFRLDGAPLRDDLWPVHRALRGERVSNVEVEVRRSDGRSWIVAFTGSAVRGEDGNVIQAVLTCRDVTERRRVEEELRRIRYNLETAQSIANVGSWDSDLVTGRLWWSEETYRIFGVPPEASLTTEDFYRLVWPEDRERVRGQALAAVAGRHDYESEHRIVRSDGEVRYVQQRAKVFTGPNGQPVRLVGSIQDITDQRNAERELNAQREQLEAMFQAMQDAVTVFDMEGNLVLVNAAGQRLAARLGIPAGSMSRDDFASAGSFATLDGQAAPVEEWPVSRVLRGESLRDLELLWRRRETGEEWCFSFSGAPVLDAAGQQFLAVVITRDVSEVKRAVRALADSENRYRTMVQSCPIGLVIGGITGNAKGTLSLVNDAYLRLTGYSREEFESGAVRWDAITPPEWAAADEAGILDVLQHGVASPYEKEYVRKDGSRAPVLAALALMPGGEEVAAFVADLSERVESERALRESEERLRMTMEAANVGMFDYRPDSGQVFLDDRSRVFWNVASGEDPSYEAMMPRIHATDASRVRESIAAALEPGSDGSFASEYRVVSEDGAVRWLVSKGRVHFASEGGARRAVRMLGINLDVSETKRREEALRELTTRFETLANNISQLAWMADREGVVYWFNQRWYDYTGTARGDMRIDDSVVHPDHRRRVSERFRRSLETGDPWEDTFPLRSRTGGYRWFLSRALPIRNEAGEIATWFGTNTDITELRETAAELERINRIVKLAHAAGKSGAWDWNLQTGELTWTEEYFRLFGIEPDFKPTLKRFFSFVHPDDRQAVKESIQAAVRERSTEFRSEYRTIHSGSVRWIEQRAQVLSDDSGAPVRVVGISTDITERKQLEQALIQSNEDLARFAYASSHDLQEPLRIISSFSTLLERRNRGRLDRPSEEFLTHIVEGANRMSGMVSDLLQYSHVSTQPTEVAEVDLNMVLRSALSNLRPAIDETGATVTSEELPVVSGNEGLLERVFRNLVGNSLKYRSRDRSPVVRIGVVRRGGYWEFSVADNGIGFKPEYAEQVFVMFKRLHGAGAYAGSGIGLAIVKRIVERHGGTVRAESQPGHGSTFYFSLPAQFAAVLGGDQTAGSS